MARIRAVKPELFLHSAACDSTSKSDANWSIITS